MGFEGLSSDEFKTIELARLLVTNKIIKPKNNSEKGIQFRKHQKQEDSDENSDC